MDAAAEHGRNPVSNHQIQGGCMCDHDCQKTNTSALYKYRQYFLYEYSINGMIIAINC